MIFQELLNQMNLDKLQAVMEKRAVNKEEQEIYFHLISEFITRSVEEQEGELLFEIIHEKEEVAVLEDGFAYAVDFIPWNEILGYRIDMEFLKKQTTIENFVFLVLFDMTYEGFDEEKRQKRIEELLTFKTNIDRDESWYVINETLQGKDILLVAEEMYQRDEFVEEGVRAYQLTESGKAHLWSQEK